MTKEELNKIKGRAKFCVRILWPHKVDFGAGPYLNVEGMDHKVAHFFGGPYNETPMEQMEQFAISRNSARELAEDILRLVPLVKIKNKNKK